MVISLTKQSEIFFLKNESAIKWHFSSSTLASAFLRFILKTACLFPRSQNRTRTNHIYQTLRSGRIWHKVIFKRSLTGLNSEFSFSFFSVLFDFNAYRIKRIERNKTWPILSVCAYIYIYIYIYMYVCVCVYCKVKLATVVKGNQKAPLFNSYNN